MIRLLWIYLTPYSDYNVSYELTYKLFYLPYEVECFNAKVPILNNAASNWGSLEHDPVLQLHPVGCKG
jgi:hypothetical protein